jgi:hypothetical protein
MDKTYADQDVKARDVIEAVMQAAWISVEDALPEPYKSVLVFRRRTWFAPIDIPRYEETYHNGKRFDGSMYQPTHWMPIPEYKGE